MAILQPKCTAPSRAAHQVQRFLQLSVDRKRILELGLGNFNHVTRDNRSNTYNAETQSAYAARMSRSLRSTLDVRRHR